MTSVLLVGCSGGGFTSSTESNAGSFSISEAGSNETDNTLGGNTSTGGSLNNGGSAGIQNIAGNSSSIGGMVNTAGNNSIAGSSGNTANDSCGGCPNYYKCSAPNYTASNTSTVPGNPVITVKESPGIYNVCGGGCFLVVGIAPPDYTSEFEYWCYNSPNVDNFNADLPNSSCVYIGPLSTSNTINPMYNIAPGHEAFRCINKF